MSGKRVKRSRKEAEEKLIQQIRLLENACILFDNGERDEALNIAMKLRVLLHDGGNSDSILHQLNIKNKIGYFDVAIPFNPLSIAPSYLLIQIVASNQYQGYHFNDDIISNKTPKKPFEDWWNKQIVISNGRTFIKKEINFTRREVVLYLADTDGGAHIDPKLDEKYFKMTREDQGIYLNVAYNKSPTGKLEWKQVLKNDDNFYYSVRTIAYEFLASLQNFEPSISFRTIRIKS